MNLTVCVLGDVGSVTTACLAEDGHQVVGVDSNRKKVEIVNSGRAPTREPGLDDRIASVIASGRLQAAVAESEQRRQSVGT